MPAPLKFDIKRLSIVHRAVLSKLVKPRELLRDALQQRAIVAGLSRKRGRSQFTDETVDTAITQLDHAGLIKLFIRYLPLDAYAPGATFTGWTGNQHWSQSILWAKLTVEGWIIVAALQLDKRY